MSSNANSEKGDVTVESETTHRSLNVQNYAERGHAATDQYGHSLVHIDPKVESRLRLKLDLYTVPTVSLLYLFCFIDRANIGNAKIAGFEKDLGLVGYDYNMILSAFYISYILFEIPSNICCKWMGPGWFIPGICLGFGVLSLCTAFVQNKAQAAAVRFLLGVFESGTLPGIAYYLSRWYKRAELSFRLSLYMIMAPLAGAFGSLLASAILKLDHFGGVHGWRMIFAIEGIITMGLSVIAFFTMTDRPESAKWLTQEEKDLVIARVKSERIATTVVLDKIDKPKIWRGILNPVTLGIGFLFLLNNITVQGLAFFAPTIVANIFPNDTVVRKQLLTAPPYLVGALALLIACFVSWKIDRRTIIMAASAPAVITGYAIFVGSNVQGAKYAATFLIASSTFFFGPLSNAQISANVVSDTARSSGIGTNVMMGNLGGLIATWSYLPNDKPRYLHGHGLNLAVSVLILIVSVSLLLWMKRDNKKRDTKNVDEILAGKSVKEIEDMDWKHPAFRWQY